MNIPTVLAMALLLGVIFVNGWTDAPSAIAACVATRSLPIGRAVLLAAAGNLAGGLAALPLGGAVASTVFAVADFGGEADAAMCALSAAMCAVVIWAVAAWRFGIPTSESHALIAGLSGSAVALQKGLSAIRAAEWGKVLLGLLVSTLPVYAVAMLASSGITRLCENRDRRRTMRAFRGAQIFGAAATSFCHGAQDGQKFMAVFMLILSLAQGEGNSTANNIPFGIALVCTVTMAAGTMLGGGRIIRNVGGRMVKLDPAMGFSADLASAVCLLGCTAAGLPVSTTHAKTCAMMGAGKGLDRRVVAEMLIAWGLTFPICALLGWGMTILLGGIG